MNCKLFAKMDLVFSSLKSGFNKDFRLISIYTGDLGMYDFYVDL